MNSSCVPPCGGLQTNCNGECVKLQSDVNHCGMCGMPCGQGQLCVMGQCRANCAPPLLPCNGGTSCVDPRFDPDNCNGCGQACPPTPGATRLCIMGMCGRSICDFGFGDCNVSPSDGCEANFANDPMACGGCGNVCNLGQSCVSGMCQ